MLAVVRIPDSPSPQVALRAPLDQHVALGASAGATGGVGCASEDRGGRSPGARSGSPTHPTRLFVRFGLLEGPRQDATVSAAFKLVPLTVAGPIRRAELQTEDFFL